MLDMSLCSVVTKQSNVQMENFPLFTRAGHIIFPLNNELIIADNYLSPINAVFIIYHFYRKRLLLTGFYFEKVHRERA